MLLVDIGKCIGCGVCELICSSKHHAVFDNSKSRIHSNIFLDDAVAIPIFCYHCEDPFCGKMCPAGAITVKKDESSGTTLVTVSEEKCVGCRMCMMVCPYGCIIVSDQGYAEKCDLCGGDPECVKYCPTKAISFVEPELSMIAKKRDVARSILNLIKNKDTTVILDE